MSTEIYTLTHKPFTPPTDPIYVPLSVFCDDKENIADKNCYYSELTGCYYAWKNSQADIIGICHYRRYLLNDEGRFYNEKEIQNTLREYDLITTKVLTLNFPYEYGFSKNHKPYYLKELKSLLFEKYPEEYKVYKRLVSGVNTLFGNMLICKRELFCDYHSWLFSILFDLEKRIIIDEPDSYHRRIFGFISEFLLYVYVEMKNLSCKHSMVGMVGEKTEVREIKERLWEYFKTGDYFGAKDYFLEQHKKRPDILMEASDIGWELHYCMEAISICEYEADEGIAVFLNKITTFDEMIKYLRNLNNRVRKNEDTKGYSNAAVFVAKTLIDAESSRLAP